MDKLFLVLRLCIRICQFTGSYKATFISTTLLLIHTMLHLHHLILFLSRLTTCSWFIPCLKRSLKRVF